MRPSSDEVLGRVLDELERYPEGVHRLGDPAYILDSELPAGLADVYRCFDGGDLFHESLILVPSSSVRVAVPSGDLGVDLFWVGEVSGDELWVDRSGGVWRREAAGGPILAEATAFDRWLSGYVDAEALIFDPQGEFRDGVFGEGGEIEPAVAIDRERAMLRRDRRAVGPRYRLGLHLARAGAVQEARRCFEEVVADAPGHAFAWVELAKISERLGELDSAIDEMVEAARVEGSGEFAPLLWAGAARLAAELGDGERRAECAREALAAEPGLVEQLCRGAESELADGYTDEAAGLLALARPLAPRHLRVLDLSRRLTEKDPAS